MKTEIHTMKPFRRTGKGVIQLDYLARQENMRITIGEIEISPVGYNTYGHPVISEHNFEYYKALRSNHARESKTFLLKVEYEVKPFVIRKDVFDSKGSLVNAISDAASSLDSLKQILIYRKQFYFAEKQNLNVFVLFNKYILAQNGCVYSIKNSTLNLNEDVIQVENLDDILFGEEVHIPDSEDVCPICGKPFKLQDIKDGIVFENANAEKHHTRCYKNFHREVELSTASQIIDAVYDDCPPTICKENGIYSYDTSDGKISIIFENEEMFIDFTEAKYLQEKSKHLVNSKVNAINLLEKIRKENN